MAVIEVDGKKLDVEDDANLLDACLSHSLDLPYFCWHPAMGSVGSCRQCAVRVYANEQDQRGKILMACMTPVQDGMRLSVDEAEVSQFRDKSIEVTMANHPHDCPVCEEGGECHLQDMTIMSNHTSRRYRGKKKTYQNQYLGPCIGHEMNRCITCYRCVRFYNDYAGGKDLAAMASRANVYFGRHEEGCLENVFSGNLVEVCPTGVFTDKTLARSYTRKWDLQSAPSICEGCGLGCNISPNERYGTVKRIVNRYHHDINGYFLCDRGRFGYDHINHSSRVQHCQSAGSESLEYDDAIELSANLLSDIDQGKIFGIGSDRASVEENILLRQIVGEESFCSGLNQCQHRVHQQILSLLRNPNITTPTLREIEECDAILILGEDLLNTAPRMALSVRQATGNLGKALAKKARIPLWQDASVRTIAQDQRSPLIIASIAGTELDEIASHTVYKSPSDIAGLGFAIANAIDSSVSSDSSEFGELAKEIAGVLTAAKNPLVISGASLNSSAVLNAAEQVSKALAKKFASKSQLSLVLPAANSLGLMLVCGEQACDIEQVFSTVTANPGEYSLVILQNDLRSLPAGQIDQLCSACKHIIVIEQHQTDIAGKAELLIPAKAVVETEGTFVNNEGRAQRFFEVYEPQNASLKDNWKTLVNIARAQCNRTNNQRLQPIANLKIFDDVVHFVADLGGDFKQWSEVAPDAKLRIAGMKMPRQTHRYSGRTSIYANTKVAENKQPQDEDSALTFSMEGAPINVPSSLNAIVWSPGWNSNEAINKFQDEIGGHLKGGDPGLRIVNKATVTSTDFDSKTPVINVAENQLLAVSAQRLFDDDRRMAMSAALIQRAPDAKAQMNSRTAQGLKLNAGRRIKICLGDAHVEIGMVINDTVAENVLVVPNNIHTQQQFPTALLPAAVEVETL